MLRVKDIMTTNVVAIDETETIQTAAARMNQQDVGSLVVQKNRLPVGIVTETDFTRKAVQNNLPATTPVKEVMTSPIYYSGPDADMIEIANMMSQNNIKKLPVLSGDQLLGVVTQTDIINHIFDSVKSIEQAYQEGNLTPQQYVQKSSQLLKNFSGPLDGNTKQWHMRCEECGHQFLNPEQEEGALQNNTCPQCGSTQITYDKTPRF